MDSSITLLLGFGIGAAALWLYERYKFDRILHYLTDESIRTLERGDGAGAIAICSTISGLEDGRHMKPLMSHEDAEASIDRLKGEFIGMPATLANKIKLN